MVWLLVLYVYMHGDWIPQQMPHEFNTQEECHRAADIIDRHHPYATYNTHVCIAVTKTR